MRQSTNYNFIIRNRPISKLPMRQSTFEHSQPILHLISKLPMRQSTTDPDFTCRPIRIFWTT